MNVFRVNFQIYNMHLYYMHLKCLSAISSEKYLCVNIDFHAKCFACYFCTKMENIFNDELIQPKFADFFYEGSSF